MSNCSPIVGSLLEVITSKKLALLRCHLPGLSFLYVYCETPIGTCEIVELDQSHMVLTPRWLGVVQVEISELESPADILGSAVVAPVVPVLVPRSKASLVESCQVRMLFQPLVLFVCIILVTPDFLFYR